jgi:hypothetical protein
MTASEERKKTMEGVFVISWLMKHLGFSKVDLDWVIDGLRPGLLDGMQVKPNGCMGLDLMSDPGLELGTGVEMDPGLDLDSIVDSDSGAEMDLVSNPSLDLEPVSLLDRFLV